jgi:hypothetical protein
VLPAIVNDELRVLGKELREALQVAAVDTENIRRLDSAYHGTRYHLL